MEAFLRNSHKQIKGLAPNGPTVYTRGPIIPELRRSGMLSAKPRFKPHEREALERMLKLHEASELRYVGKGVSSPSFESAFKHSSPGVIVEESNMVATLPKRLRRAGDALSELRNDSTGEARIMEELVPGFKYGKTRMSRHAKRRLSEIIERKIAASGKLWR